MAERLILTPEEHEALLQAPPDSPLWDKLFKKWDKVIDNKIYGWLRKHGHTEDVKQAVRKEAEYSLRKAKIEDLPKFGGLLRKITGCVAFNMKRDLKQIPTVSSDDTVNPKVEAAMASDETIRRQTDLGLVRKKLDEAIDQLPSRKRREVVRLRYLKGFPDKKIAKKLKMSHEDVRVNLTRAREALPNLLPDEIRWWWLLS